jgi:hypothetical protein
MSKEKKYGEENCETCFLAAKFGGYCSLHDLLLLVGQLAAKK